MAPAVAHGHMGGALSRGVSEEDPGAQLHTGCGNHVTPGQAAAPSQAQGKEAAVGRRCQELFKWK